MEIDRDGLEVLDRVECLRLLAGASVGRVAGTSGALPVVLPLPYVLDGDSIVFETGLGSTVDFMSSGSVVAFEVDNLHERGRSSWTVMATGIAQPVLDDHEVDRLRALLPGDSPEQDARFLRLSLELVSGRRTHRTHRHARSRAAARLAERVG
jgi:nitroimidazol reductase NimA-like FMN-containing flavoprotein (pyridoxamine 5'-phosphate oxidase superfamily)